MTTSGIPGTIRIRAIRPGDSDALAAFYRSLSPDASEARFMGAAPQFGPLIADYFCGPDHHHREGLVAEALDPSGRMILVGHLCLEPVTADVAEMAIAVADGWRRHGIGRRLLLAAVDWARANGVPSLAASMRSSNGAVLALVRSIGCRLEYDAIDAVGAGTIDVLIDVAGPVPVAA